MRAALAGEEPGELELSAQIEGLGSRSGALFTRARASGKVHGFSSAMLDGLAQQHGKLEQVLGPRFDLSFELGDLRPTSGTLSLALQSPRTHVVLEGQVEGGVLRCSAGRGAVVELGAPRALVESYLVPLLPPGTNLVWPSTDEAWKLELGALALPIPERMPENLAGWAGLGQRLELDARVKLPGPLGLENPLTRQVHLHPALSGIEATLALGPGKPLHATLAARLIAGQTGSISVDLRCADPWTPLGTGALPVVDGTLALEDLSNATLDAILGREGFLTEGLGRALDLHVELAGASLSGGSVVTRLHSANIDLGLRGRIESGAFVCSGEEGLDLRFAPPPSWSARSLAPFLPPDLALELEAKPLGVKLTQLRLPLDAADAAQFLAGTQASIDATLPGLTLRVGAAGPAQRSLALASAHVTGSLGKGGRASLRVDTFVGEARASRCTLQGELPPLSAFAGAGLPPLSFDLALEQLDTHWLDRWALGDARVPAFAGEGLDLRLRATELTLRSGRIDVLVQSPKLHVELALAGQSGRWQAVEGAPNRVALALERSDLERELAPHLPPGTELSLDPAAHALELKLQSFALALPADPAQLADPAVLRAALEAELELGLPSFGFANEQTRALGIQPSLANVSAHARCAAGGELSGTLDARLSGAGEAQLHAEVAGRSLDEGQLALRLDGLSTPAVDALLGRPAFLSGLVGETLALNASLSRKAGAGTLALSLRAPRASLDLAGRLQGETLALVGAHACELHLTPSDAWLASQLGPFLPAGASLKLDASAPGELVVRAEVPQLALPAADQDWQAWLARTTLKLDATLPAFAWRETADGPVLALRALALELALAPDAAPHARLSGEIAADPAGTLACEIAALDPLRQLGEEHGLERFRVALHVRAQGVPVGLVDALARQDGLLVEALGPRADLALESAGLSLQSGAVTLDLSAPPNTAHLDGVMQQGLLTISKPKGLTARFALGPLTSTRVVGRLVPLLCQLSKPAGAAPAAIEVDALALPLDGDLSKLDGTVRIDLGQVNYAILPGLSGLFGAQGAPKALELPAFSVPIQHGIVRYDKLQLPIGGRLFAFHGSYDLVRGELALGTEVPLEILGSKISGELDKARDFLDPKMLVPIEIRGAWNKPHLAIGQGFLDGVVKKALGNALEKGLEGLLKKKPKKD